MGEIEAIGEAVTGAAKGRAIEPHAGESGADGHSHERNCLNCGCGLLGDYCHCCGQRGHVHRTIAAWWHDFLHSVLHLDGKFWRTLPMLAWRPGELTRRYALGERAKFISPLALFLFTVFLMFAVFSFAGPGLGEFDTQEGLSQGIAESREDLRKLEENRAEAIAENRSTERIDSRIRDKKEEIETLEMLRERGIASAALTRTDDRPVGGSTWFEDAFRKAEQNPELLLYKLQANAYKFSWALIPISVPFVWLLFLHRRRYRREFTAYDHLVFVTYSIAFMSMGLVLFVVLGSLGAGGDLLGLAFALVPPIHMYRQLRGAYGLSQWSAAWRAFMLLVFASIALTLFAMLLLLLGMVD